MTKRYANYEVIEENSCVGGVAKVADGKYAIGTEFYTVVGETAEERCALKETKWFYEAHQVFATEAEALAVYDQRQAAAVSYFDRHGTANE